MRTVLIDSNLQPGFIPFRKDVNWNFTKVRCQVSNSTSRYWFTNIHSACASNTARAVYSCHVVDGTRRAA